MTTSPTSVGRGQHDQHEGDAQHRGTELPDRAALADLVDPVHRAAEGADVPGRGPERAGEPEDQGEPGRLRCGSASISVGSSVSAAMSAPTSRRISSSVSTATRPGRPGRRGRAARWRPGTGEHGVVGQRGREVGALVLGELAQRLAGDVEPRPLRELPAGRRARARRRAPPAAGAPAARVLGESALGGLLVGRAGVQVSGAAHDGPVPLRTMPRHHRRAGVRHGRRRVSRRSRACASAARAAFIRRRRGRRRRGGPRPRRGRGSGPASRPDPRPGTGRKTSCWWSCDGAAVDGAADQVGVRAPPARGGRGPAGPGPGRRSPARAARSVPGSGRRTARSRSRPRPRGCPPAPASPTTRCGTWV